MPVLDAFGRPLRDLRISVTDRCNFRCTYCMPKKVFGKDYRFLDRKELLTFEEITRVARASVDVGVAKLRLTGGEPLLRVGIEELIEMLSALPRRPDADDERLARCRRRPQALKDAGLKRITVSLDSLDDDDLQGDERRRLPGLARARGDRGRAGRRACRSR